MRPIVDIIGDVITAMKPLSTGLILGGGSENPDTIIGFTRTDLFFVGQKIKVIGGSPSVTAYCTVATIAATYITITTSDTVNPGTVSVQPVLNYHYGHGIEIVNTFLEMTKNATYKKAMFPAICLIQDFPERITANGYEREATLNIVICTDSKQAYKAPDRYTYTFEPILYPLYDLFIDRLQESAETAPDYPEHDRTDRLAWGKSGLYGNTANIFNDFVDAIELENLKLKTFKTCE